METPSTSTGFTIVELVLVIAILGVVTLIALPRFFSSAGFVDSFADSEVRAVLRYAQKMAVKTNCPVRVTVTTGPPAVLALAQSTNVIDCTDLSATAAVPGPTPGRSLTPILDGQSVTISATASPFLFDALGQATVLGIPTDVTVTVGSTAISIEGETGFLQ